MKLIFTTGAALALMGGTALAAGAPATLAQAPGSVLVAYKPKVKPAPKPAVKPQHLETANPLPAAAPPGWAQENVKKAFDYGVFNGQYKQGFDGDSAMTRYHAAVMTTKLYDRLKEGQGFEVIARQTDFASFDRQVALELQNNVDDLRALSAEVQEMRAQVAKLKAEKLPPMPAMKPPPVVLPPMARADRWNPMDKLGFAPDFFMPTDGDLDPGVGWALDYSLSPRNKRGLMLGVGQVHELGIPSTGDMLDINRASLSYMFKSRSQRGLNYGLGLDWLDVSLATPGVNYTDTVLGYHLRATWPIGKHLLSEVRYQQADLDQLAPAPSVTPDPSGVSFRWWGVLGR